MIQPRFTLAQIKLHRYFGGGEVFARFICEAVAALGGRTLLLTHPEASHWGNFRLPATERIEARTVEEAIGKLPPGVPLMTHAPLPDEIAARVARERVLVGVVHMPFGAYYTQDSQAYRHYHQVIPVSAYVSSTLQGHGFRVYPEPLYGYADFDRLDSRTPFPDRPLVARSEFEWDQRKVRDRLLGWSEPLWSRLRSPRPYVKHPGLTLGIVSRIAPIKQFPLLFSLIAPRIARIPVVNLEIFGAGGYASVRDLKHALRPLGNRARFWGHQPDVARVYKGIDILMTGLPEKEALGLNVVEAQAAGVPVLAVHAPPFTETVLDTRTGFFYVDPRQDGGEDFERVLRRLVSLAASRDLPDPSLEQCHLERFSKEAFIGRMSRLLGQLGVEAALNDANRGLAPQSRGWPSTPAETDEVVQ